MYIKLVSPMTDYVFRKPFRVYTEWKMYGDQIHCTYDVYGYHEWWWWYAIIMHGWIFKPIKLINIALAKTCNTVYDEKLYVSRLDSSLV